MKIIIVLSLLSFCSVMASAQCKKKTFTNNHTVKRYFAMKGDLIYFECDSVMLLNRSSYRVLDSAYTRLHIRFFNLMAKGDSVSLINQKLFEGKSEQYDAIRNSFNILRDSTAQQMRFVNNRLNDVDNDLVFTRKELTSATDYLKQAYVNINKANKQKWKGRIVSGLIGFGLASSLIILTK